MGLRFDIERLRQRRTEKGWSQHDLERASGVDNSTINRIERELQNDVYLSVILDLARALDLSLDEILLSDDQRVAPEQFERDLAIELRALAHASPSEQQHAARLLAVFRAALADRP